MGVGGGGGGALLLDVDDFLQTAHLAFHAVNTLHQNKNLLPGTVGA